MNNSERLVGKALGQRPVNFAVEDFVFRRPNGETDLQKSAAALLGRLCWRSDGSQRGMEAVTAVMMDEQGKPKGPCSLQSFIAASCDNPDA